MRFDSVTKVLLGAIVILLAVIAFRPSFGPTTAHAQSVSSWVLPLGIVDNNSMLLLSPQTGDVWLYTDDNRALYRGQLFELGKPLKR